MTESEILDFVRFSIRSIWNIELLLHLRRSRERGWASPDLVRELRASGSIVGEGLRTLETAGLAVSDQSGLWRYSPASETFSRLVDELELLYRERPTLVSQALFARTEDKLRSFADAFRLRKD